jgi:hypothetical protein
MWVWMGRWRRGESVSFSPVERGGEGWMLEGGGGGGHVGRVNGCEKLVFKKQTNGAATQAPACVQLGHHLRQTPNHHHRPAESLRAPRLHLPAASKNLVECKCHNNAREKRWSASVTIMHGRSGGVQVSQYCTGEAVECKCHNIAREKRWSASVTILHGRRAKR